MMSGQVRVGRRIYDKNTGSWVDPSFEGFTPIVVMTACSQYTSLSPFILKDENGVNMENHWQSSKVYETVPDVVQHYSRWDRTVIWKHKSERHANKTEKGWSITPAYLKWRAKLRACQYAVRYPVGYHHRHKCLFALADTDDGKISPKPLDYISSRKAIYAPVYRKLVQSEKQFTELLDRLTQGENLLIIEVDGPHEESLDHYKELYDVSDDFIVNDTMLCTEENLSIMLNDEKHAYGHGYLSLIHI